MERPIFVMDGMEYPLATTLRVAYMIQGQNGHRSYTELLGEIDSMPLEKQIDIVYASFSIANPDAAKTVNSVAFRNYCFDNLNMGDLMELLKSIIGGIMGDKFMEKMNDTEDTEDNADSKNE